MPDTLILMPQIDFYIIADQAADAWLRYTCRLVEKAYTLGMRIHIHTPDEDLTNQLDELLWVFRDRSFIPHQQHCSKDEFCVVTLNHNQPPAHRQLLINLSPATPDFFNEYERIIEVVGANDKMKQQARDRFRFYRQQGLTPTHHQIN